MINAPQMNGTQQVTQPQRKPAFAPSYNAVQINLDTPTLNAPPAMPYYPPVNMGPYNPKPPVQPPAPQGGNEETTVTVPEPVLTGDTGKVDVPADVKPEVVVQTPEEQDPKTLVDEAFKGLSSSDYDTQALVMESLAKKGLPDENGVTHQEELIPYVSEEIFDKLIEIMNVDTKDLPQATDEQIAIRNKIAENDQAIEDAVKAGKDPNSIELPNKVTAQEEELANKLSPYEQAERNKEYAMFTTCILQKTYADEVQKQSGTVVPITDLPGAKAIILTLKENPNDDMRCSAIDALRYVERPEYKEDLTTLYSIAQNDESPKVQEAATMALENLNNPQQ